MNDKPKGKMERLNETLYSRTRYHDPLKERTSIMETDSSDVETEWQSPKLDEMLKHERIERQPNTLMKKILDQQKDVWWVNF